MRDGAVIAGGGLAAQRCAETLRRVGYEGRVRMVCAEHHLPYDRPPLSKAVLADPAAEDMAGVETTKNDIRNEGPTLKFNVQRSMFQVVNLEP